MPERSDQGSGVPAANSQPPATRLRLPHPGVRGHGLGTSAHRQLVELLFATTPAHRLQAGTEVDNVAEQRALEKAGFQREGIQRGMYFRAGRWRDSVLYGLLRDDLSERPAT